MRLADLDGHSVAVWGSGREAGAFIHAIRNLNLDLDVRIVDESKGQASIEGIEVRPFSVETLQAADYVLRSPGVSIYRSELRGLRVITATGLWFAEPHVPVVAVTGTKGKSTTSSLIAHILCRLGVDARLAGNIGRSPLDFAGQPEPEIWVLELSSFQIADVDVAPDIAVLTSLDSDHLDWHGGREQYVNDKLRLFAHAKKSIVNVADAGVVAVMDRLPDAVGIDATTRVGRSRMFGEHNRQLIRLAVAVVRATGVDVGVDVDARAQDIEDAVASFEPLPHRLEWIADVDGVTYVNDSLSTNPIAATAAVEAFSGRPIALLVGGHDRGIDFGEFGEFLAQNPDVRVYTMPECGERIAAAIGNDRQVVVTDGLAEAVQRAAAEMSAGGVVLLSPAAASFGSFANYAERGDEFRRLVMSLKKP